MKRLTSAFSFFLLLLYASLPGKVLAQPAMVMGVNMVNPQRLDAAQQNDMLAQMKAAGVRVIRCGITPDDKGLDFAKRVYAQGISIEWIVSIQYSANAPSRAYQPAKFPNAWGGHPLSAADADLFRKYFDSFLARLEGAGIVLTGFELGNEINWAPFNAEFTLPGEGKNMSLENLYHDPEGKQIAKGYLQYLKVLAALKDIRDHSKLNQQTPILLAGLADSGAEGAWPNAKMDGVSINATLAFLRANGLDKLVDVYGIHTYPWANTHAKRLDRLKKYAVAGCSIKGSGSGKPCWITEWGIDNKDVSCPCNDTARAAIVKDMMGDFRDLYKQGRLTGLIYFSWNSDPWSKQLSASTIFRCGSITPAGKLALTPFK